MSENKVVSIASRRIGQEAKEYAVFFSLSGNDVQFKLLGGDKGGADNAEIAEACEAMAKALRRPRY